MQKGIIIGMTMLFAASVFSPRDSHSQQVAFSTGDLTFKGDLRYRHEQISQEGKRQRDRQRIRARMSVTAVVDPNVNFVFGLAGGGGNDPISSNQDLGAGFSDKQIWIDNAYFDWKTPLTGMKLRGGKMGNPFYTAGGSQMIWDGDLRPEGLAAQYSKKFDTTEFFANASYFWVTERSAAKDNFLLGAQAGINQTMGDAGLSFGAGLYDYTNARGLDTFYDSSKSFGNSVNAGNKYLFDYRVAEVFGQLAANGVLPVPASVFFDYATNIASDVKDKNAYQIGATLGKTAQKGSMAAKVIYQYLERDALIGAFSDSDFGGGGTNNKGFVVQCDYLYAKNVTLSSTLFLNKLGTKEVNNVSPKDYNRLQIDAIVKF